VFPSRLVSKVQRGMRVSHGGRESFGWVVTGIGLWWKYYGRMMMVKRRWYICDPDCFLLLCSSWSPAQPNDQNIHGGGRCQTRARDAPLTITRYPPSSSGYVWAVVPLGEWPLGEEEDKMLLYPCENLAVCCVHAQAKNGDKKILCALC
jgi:hypothetical protein